MDGKSGRGRPGKCWKDNLRDWSGRIAGELMGRTEDGERWRDGCQEMGAATAYRLTNRESCPAL